MTKLSVGPISQSCSKKQVKKRKVLPEKKIARNQKNSSKATRKFHRGIGKRDKKPRLPKETDEPGRRRFPRTPKSKKKT